MAIVARGLPLTVRNSIDEAIQNSAAQLEQRLSTAITQTGESIKNEVAQQYYAKGDTDRIIAEASTILEQKYNSFEMSFNSFKQMVDSNQNLTNAEFATITKFIRFIDGNIFLGAIRIHRLNSAYYFYNAYGKVGHGDFSGNKFESTVSMDLRNARSQTFDLTDLHSECTHNADGSWPNGTYCGWWEFKAGVNAYNSPEVGWTYFRVYGSIHKIPRATVPTLSENSVNTMLTVRSGLVISVETNLNRPFRWIYETQVRKRSI